MIEDMRRYVREGLGMLGGQGSDDVTENVRARVQAVAEQMSALAAGFLGWSAEARASLLREVKDLVTRQVKEMGLATQKEMDALRARIQELERPGRATARPRRAAASKATSGRSTASRSRSAKSKSVRAGSAKSKSVRAGSAKSKSVRTRSAKTTSGRTKAASRSGGEGRASSRRSARSPRSAST